YRGISQAMIDNIEELLPSREDLPTLFIQMQALAEDAGTELMSVSFAAGTIDAAMARDSQLRALDIDLKLSGGTKYDDVKSLLNTIEHARPLLDVTSISFSLEGTETVALESAGGEYSISLRTYYLDTTASSPAADINASLESLQPAE
ncbi:MAG: hypothetical protein V1791_10290, partial [Pseudomonadota bacterium]